MYSNSDEDAMRRIIALLRLFARMSRVRNYFTQMLCLHEQMCGRISDEQREPWEALPSMAAHSQ